MKVRVLCSPALTQAACTPVRDYYTGEAPAGLGQATSLSNNALPDLKKTLAEWKIESGTLERHFELREAHVGSCCSLDVGSVEGFRLPLNLRRINGRTEKEHAKNMDVHPAGRRRWHVTQILFHWCGDPAWVLPPSVEATFLL